MFVPANDVSFTTASPRVSYKIGEPIAFVYRIRNVSHSPIFIPKEVWDQRCLPPPHVWAGLEDTSGKHFMPGYGGSCLVPPNISVADRMRNDAVLLKPGEVFQNSFRLETGMFTGALMPGEFRLETTFSGGVTKT